jgi:hypothetical protein
MTPENIHISQKKRIRSFSVDKNYLRRLLELLQERAYTAADIEEQKFEKRPEHTEEQFKQAKQELREGFELFITLSGVDGRMLTGNISQIFDSPNFPEDVKEVFFDTATSLRSRYGYAPRNKMILFLDFRRPEVLNFTILPSQETVNESNFEIEGRDATWVNGVFQEFFNFVERRPSTSPWLHRHTVYDLLLWLVGFPLSFWACTKLSRIVEGTFGYSPFLKSALYFYVFLIAINLLRVAFHYARWIWPLTEFQSERSKSLKHKAILSLIVSGLGLAAVYDLIKWLFS